MDSFDLHADCYGASILCGQFQLSNLSRSKNPPGKFFKEFRIYV